MNSGADSFEAATASEALAQGVAFTTDDHEVGATAYVEGREPAFEGK